MTRRTTFWLAFLIVFVSATSTRAEGGITWTPTNGPTGGQINTLALAPGLIYAGANNGVFISRDDGAHWQAISRGLPEALTINALAILSDPNQVLAGTREGIYRTRDGGATWTLADPRLADQFVLALLIDPQSPNIIYAGTTATILKSENTGETWSETGKELPSARVWGLAAAPDGSAIFAATETSVYVSRDRGAHWQTSAEGLPSGARPQSIVATARGYVLGTTQGVYRSRDGKTWSAVGGALANGLARPLVTDAKPSDRVYAVIGQNIFKSADGGTAWSPLKNPAGDLPMTALGLGEKNSLYTGTARGVWKSNDDGANWQMLNEGLVNSSVHTLLFTPGKPGTLIAATRYGIALSRDRGATWRDAQGLKDPYIGSLTRDPANASILYAGTQGGSIFVSRDGGETFSLLADNLANNAPISSLLVWQAPANTSDLYAGTQGGGLYKSADNGARWEKQTNGLSNVARVTALAFAPPATIYAGTERGLFALDVSKPGGAWQAIIAPNSPGDEVRVIAIDPQNAQTLLIGHATTGLYRKTGDNPQWQELGLGSAGGRVRYHTIAFNPGMTGVIYVGTDRGVYRSEDNGASWSAASDGLTIADVPALAIDPETPTAIFAGTNGNGVMRGEDNLSATTPDLFTIGAVIGAILSAVIIIGFALVGWRARFGTVAQDRSWRREYPGWESAINDALWKYGEANATNLAKLPRRYLSRSLQRYIEEHPGDALTLQISPAALKLEAFTAAQKFLSHWKAAWQVVESADAFKTVTSQMTDQLCAMLGFTRMEDRAYHGLVGYVVKAPALRLKIPPRFPIIFIPRHETGATELNELRDLMGVLSMVSYFALVIDLRDLPTGDNKQSLKRLAREATHDFIVLDGADMRQLLIAREPARRLVEMILNQVDLTVVSPYVTSGPVPENMFFGRESELKTIVRTVRDTNFAIVGGRKIGKTSVLARVHQHLKDSPEYEPFYLDCQAVHTHADFFSAVDTMWRLALPTHTPEGFRAAGIDLCTRHGSRIVVLLFDEIDDLLRYDIEHGERLFQILRALAQESRMRFVFCGEKVLNAALHDPRLVFFNFCNLIPLSYLSRAEAQRVVTDPMQEMGVALEGDTVLADRIVELAAGHPNIVQYVCQKLIERINARRERVITRTDVAAFSQSAQFAEYFAEVSWGAASPLERLVTLLMLEKPEVTLGEMAETLRTRELRVRPAQLDNAFDDLCLYSILQREGPKYTFAAKAFPEVLRRSQDVYGLILSYSDEIQKGDEAING
ncbi:MAG: AAA family ATPase [Chloroflexi bacterium]|nr:AAA family ATPase [Chloroflexota bacterium]